MHNSHCCRRFDSQIFDLYVGPEKRHFAVHRAVLNQSPQIRSLCNTQALSKNGGAKGRTTLSLERDDPKGIGHLLEYLYTNKFTVRGVESLDEAKQLADLYLLASNYTLPGLQEAVITQLESSHTSSKITAMQFFNMAEDLYSEEPHVAMREYFAKVAPGLLRTVAEDELQELLRMISEGGDFATDLFAAHHQAFGPGHLPASHPESETQDGPVPKSETTDEPLAGPDNIRTAWDDAHEIPSFWHEMTAADQLLITMREEGKTWNEIDHAQTEQHGKSGSISEWVSRYGRISINMAHMRMKKGDVGSPEHPKVRLMLTGSHLGGPPLRCQRADRNKVSARQVVFDCRSDGEKRCRAISTRLPPEEVQRSRACTQS